MDRRNQRNDAAATVGAAVAIGAVAGIAGYGCYKLFESFFGEPNQNQPLNAICEEKQPQSLPFRIISPHSFPKNSRIYVVNTIEECRYAMRELRKHCDEYNVLGFDCEWVTSRSFGRQKVALLQLASHSGLCVLVRLCELDHIPFELEEILKDHNIIKVGISPYNTDAQFLFNDYFQDDYNPSDNQNNHIKSTLDLRYVSRMAKCFDGENMGLAKMSEHFLGVSIEKNPNIRCSNWNADELSEEQIFYAAKDVLVAIELFKFFAEKMRRNNSLRVQHVIANCFEYVDRNFKK